MKYFIKNKKARYIVRVIMLLIIFCIIEILRLGYMKKDQAQEAVNQDRFAIMEDRIEDLENRIEELESIKE